MHVANFYFSLMLSAVDKETTEGNVSFHLATALLNDSRLETTALSPLLTHW